jgi:hypothetical protein
MSDTAKATAAKLRPLMDRVDALREAIDTLHRETGYDDLEHAGLALSIVRHALHEVEEQKGLGGSVPSTPDPHRFQLTQDLLHRVQDIRTDAQHLLAQGHQEDLATAIQALDLAAGSLQEVAEQYE